MTCPLALHPSINITLSRLFAWLLPPRLILLALLLRVISDYLPHLIEPFDNSFQAFKISLPAVIRTFVIGLLTRPEAGLLHPQHVPSVVGDNVQVTTVFNPVAAFSRDEFQLYESWLLGSTSRTWQSTTPFQYGIGVARKLNVWPPTGSKSFFISQSSISGVWVRARQTFAAGGVSRVR